MDANSKPTNPKDIISVDKLPLSMWPTTATAMGCLGLLEGALKYGRMNWREAGVRASVYIDAVKRHVDAYAEGEDDTPDSKIPHMANALACLAIIVDADANGKLIDDRAYNPRNGYRRLADKLTPHVARLRALFSGHRPKHWTRADQRECNERLFRVYVDGMVEEDKGMSWSQTTPHYTLVVASSKTEALSRCHNAYTVKSDTKTTGGCECRSSGQLALEEMAVAAEMAATAKSASSGT
jgi:hypothetical protein